MSFAAWVAKNCRFASTESDNASFNDRNIVRQAIKMELDAISTYEQMASMVKSEKLKKVLLDVAKEEKNHAGEFEFVLGELDKEHAPAVEDGMEEAKEI